MQANTAENRPVLIDIQGVRKVFRVPSGDVTALSGIDLTVREGDVYGIIGMSGAGKSTLIRCINGLEAPTEGRLLIGDTDVVTASTRELLALRRSIGMIFQSFNLLMQRTVEKNVRFPLEIAGVPAKEAKRRTAELLDIVGLSDKTNAYPAQLSGGQKQRVAIARALTTNPRVLLCDEATSALDPMTTQSILTLLADINRRMGLTIVLITHEMTVIRQICTQVAIIDNGTIAEQGEVGKIFTNPQTEAARKLFGLPQGGKPQLNGIPGGSYIRIVFDGSTLSEPIVANMVLTCGAPVSVMQAEIRHITGKSYGSLVVRLPEDRVQVEAALAYLAAQKLIVEEVHPSDFEWND